MEVFETITKTEAATLNAARDFAAQLVGGEVVLLDGDLGAGKTVFARGVAEGLGVTEPILSPTYTLLNVYSTGRLNLCHADLYRLADTDEAFSTGLTDYLGRQNTVCLIEWPRCAAALFPSTAFYVTIEKLGEESRKITIKKGNK